VRLSTPDLAKYIDAYRDPSSNFYREHVDAMTTGPMAGANAHLKPTARGGACFLLARSISWTRRHLSASPRRASRRLHRTSINVEKT